MAIIIRIRKCVPSYFILLLFLFYVIHFTHFINVVIVKTTELSFIPGDFFNVKIMNNDDVCSGHLKVCSLSDFCFPIQIPFKNAMYRFRKQQFDTYKVTISFANVYRHIKGYICRVCSSSESTSSFYIEHVNNESSYLFLFTDFVGVNTSK